MNGFSLIGKFSKYKQIDDSNIILYLNTSSPNNKKIIIPIHFHNHININKLKKDDLLGIKGLIDYSNNQFYLIAIKVIWLPNKK